MWDAAYVLGSLSSTERREYETHLSGCPPCRTAVAELSGMPALAGDAGPRRDGRDRDRAAVEPPPLRPEVLDWLLDEGALAAPPLAVDDLDGDRGGRRGAGASGVFVAVEPAPFGPTDGAADAR